MDERLGGLVERFLPYRRPFIVLTHALLVTLAYLGAFGLRFDLPLPEQEMVRFLSTLPALLVVRLVIFSRFHLYQGLWRYVSMRDLLGIVQAAALSSAAFFVVTLLFYYGNGLSRMVFALDFLLCVAFVGGIRAVIRLFRETAPKANGDAAGEIEVRRALIVGAGEAGERLLRDVGRGLRLNYDVVGFVDDSKRLKGRRIHSTRVLGTIEQLPELCRRHSVEEILVAIPSATRQQRRRIMRYCRECALPVKTMLSMQQLFSGRRPGQLEEVDPEDVLGREALEADLSRLVREVRGASVLVTGAGGSIGSELSRQLARLEPSTLVLYERDETNLFFTEREITERYPDVAIVPVVGDILDQAKLEEVFDEHRPRLVYHAAAYKHVPLMEQHPLEAIRNNVFGTEMVAEACLKHGVEKFVLVSTDKAVNPVGVMGMTKRVAESLIRGLPEEPTTFVTVRFGNVLGSAGSVLPLFHRQIAAGRPVTITDPDATRYFMLVAEAAQLILQAGSIGKGGEVFFLDMGDPVRIGDFAEDVIRLLGWAPGREVEVTTIGMRSGERMNEELVLATEELRPSTQAMISVTNASDLDKAAFHEDLEALRYVLWTRDRGAALERLGQMAQRY